MHRRRGRLHVYLGAAPGVGKTYAMLAEAERLASCGVDVGDPAVRAGLSVASASTDVDRPG